MKPNPFYTLVTLILITFLSCKNDTVKVDPVDSAPIADFTWAGKQTAPAQISFNNQTKNATSYRWDFGNGLSSMEQFPNPVTYAQEGSYDVVLIARNSGKQHLLKKTIVIAANEDPVAHFSYQFKDQRSYAPANVLLKNESVNASNFEWRINGLLYTENEPKNITFNTAGNHKIQLTAIKNGTRSAVFEQLVTVGANPDPIAKFALNYHPYPYHVGEEVQFVNLSENSDQWTWTFGTNGPASSNEQHPLVKFEKPGQFTITLVAKKGALSSVPRSINLLINPE